jgi:hypothetical protein
MGMRRRRRRRAMIAGAAIASNRSGANQPQEYEQAQPVEQEPAAPSSADEIEHLAELHASGALTDEEFADAKAKVLAS